METTKETVEKTPGDLKREEYASEKLGKGWKFFGNYPVISTSSIDFNTMGNGGITTNLEKQQQAGKIEKWQAEHDAFQNDGQKILFSKVRAAYIKPK